MDHEVQFVKETALKVLQTNLSLAVCLSILYNINRFSRDKSN